MEVEDKMKMHIINPVRISIVLFMIAVLIIILSLIITKSITQGEISRNLDSIFCQQLHTGMTLEEVREELKQYGEFEELRYDHLAYYRILITFKDEKFIKKIGTNYIYLSFYNERGYAGAELQYGVDSQGVCLDGLSKQ